MKMIQNKKLATTTLGLIIFIVLGACGRQNDSLDKEMENVHSTVQNSLEQPFMAFDTVMHDFGTIIEGEMVVCYFDYKNTGDAELVISSVEATCGCTTPDWSKEPLNSGDLESLKIVFDATGREGTQRKVVTVMSNASNSMVRLTLTAHVKESV